MFLYWLVFDIEVYNERLLNNQDWQQLVNIFFRDSDKIINKQMMPGCCREIYMPVKSLELHSIF